MIWLYIVGYILVGYACAFYSEWKRILVARDCYCKLTYEQRVKRYDEFYVNMWRSKHDREHDSWWLVVLVLWPIWIIVKGLGAAASALSHITPDKAAEAALEVAREREEKRKMHKIIEAESHDLDRTDNPCRRT